MAAASTTRSRSSPSGGETPGADGVRSSTALTLPGSQRGASGTGRHAARSAHPRPIGCRSRLRAQGVSARTAGRCGARPAGRGDLRRGCRGGHAAARPGLRHRTRAARRRASPARRPSWRPGLRRGLLPPGRLGAGRVLHREGRGLGAGVGVATALLGGASPRGRGFASGGAGPTGRRLRGVPARRTGVPRAERRRRTLPARAAPTCPGRLLVRRPGRLGARALRRHRAVARGSVHAVHRTLACGGAVRAGRRRRAVRLRLGVARGGTAVRRRTAIDRGAVRAARRRARAEQAVALRIGVAPGEAVARGRALRRRSVAGLTAEQRSGPVLDGGPVRARLLSGPALAALGAVPLERRPVLHRLVVGARRLPGHAEERHVERRRVVHGLVVGARGGLPRAREAELGRRRSHVGARRALRQRPRRGLPRPNARRTEAGRIRGGVGAGRGLRGRVGPCRRGLSRQERQVEPGLRLEERRPAVLGRHAVGAGRGLATREAVQRSRRLGAARREARDHGGGFRSACARRLTCPERGRTRLRCLPERRLLLRRARSAVSRRALPERRLLVGLAHAAEHRGGLRGACLPGRLGRLPERGLDLLRLPERRGLLGHDTGLRDAAEHRRRLRRARRLPEHRGRVRCARRGGGGLGLARRAADERQVLRSGDGLLPRRLAADVRHGRIGGVGVRLPALDGRPRRGGRLRGHHCRARLGGPEGARVEQRRHHRGEPREDGDRDGRDQQPATADRRGGLQHADHAHRGDDGAGRRHPPGPRQGDGADQQPATEHERAGEPGRRSRPEEAQHREDHGRSRRGEREPANRLSRRHRGVARDLGRYLRSLRHVGLPPPGGVER